MACRDRIDGQRGGWWCPIRNHAPFATIESARKHYRREHWDFGEWKNEPSRIRTFGHVHLNCSGCLNEAKKLELLDGHVISSRNPACVGYNLHQIMKVCFHGTLCTALRRPCTLSLSLYVQIPCRTKKRNQPPILALGEGEGEGDEAGVIVGGKQ